LLISSLQLKRFIRPRIFFATCLWNPASASAADAVLKPDSKLAAAALIITSKPSVLLLLFQNKELIMSTGGKGNLS
jgi:hypothetical protein